MHINIFHYLNIPYIINTLGSRSGKVKQPKQERVVKFSRNSTNSRCRLKNEEDSGFWHYPVGIAGRSTKPGRLLNIEELLALLTEYEQQQNLLREPSHHCRLLLSHIYEFKSSTSTVPRFHYHYRQYPPKQHSPQISSIFRSSLPPISEKHTTFPWNRFGNDRYVSSTSPVQENSPSAFEKRSHRFI